jgi:hypothetical protein
LLRTWIVDKQFLILISEHRARYVYGVHSFAAIAGGWRPHPLKQPALQLTVACAMCPLKITRLGSAPRSGSPSVFLANA